MKKCILSAIAGALAMLIAITVMAAIHSKKQCPKDYEHIDYASLVFRRQLWHQLYIQGR